MPHQSSFTGGLDLNFFPSTAFESLEGLSAPKQNPILARNALRLLMMGWQSWFSLLSWSTFKAIFIKRDPDLIRELRKAFQSGFEHVFTQLQNQEFNENQREQIQIYLSNCLALLPLADLTPYESIKIPRLIDKQWVMVDYHVTPIELTEHTDQYFIKDEDRVFAYGLDPIANPQAKSQLIFMGTTYPAGQGFLPQINTDMKGFETVGKALYRSGRERIINWMNHQKNPIDVCGISLGGSLSLLLAIDQGDRLSRVDAMNPAGLHDPWRKSRYDHWDELTNKPKVVIQQQDRDPVSIFGVWKKEWEILKVLPPKEKQGPNAFTDHFLNYAGFASTQFQYGSAEEDNKQRSKRNFWLYSIGRSMIYYPILLPYTYVVRPAAHFIWEKKSYIAPILIPFIVCFTLMALGLVTVHTVPLVAMSSLFAVGLVYLIKKYSEKTHLTHPTDGFAQLHKPSLARNPDMDIYNQTIEIQLTNLELNTYNFATRHLMKNKDFLHANDKPLKSMDGLSETELLLAARDPDKRNQSISFQVTMAKAIQIKRTLELVETFHDQEPSVIKPG